MRKRRGGVSLSVVAIAGSLLSTVGAHASPLPTPALPTSRPTAIVDPAVRARTGVVAIVVQGGDLRAVHAVIAAAHGRVTHELPIIGGVAARVPSDAVDRIGAVPGVRAITFDAPVAVASSGHDDSSGSSSPPPPPPPSTPPAPVGPHNVFNREIGQVALQKTGAADGTGITVALVDTGVNSVPDLAGAIVPVTDDQTGQTSPCLNLSGEKTCNDSYGHGTFIAGLIAGDGSQSRGTLAGVAPGARVVSVKIAGADGASDVSNVLAAIQWVVSFRDRYGIRVLNLSLGTDSTQSYRTDPLNYAVERAWSSGIVVVVAASNRGPGAGTISKPGDDPFVITVGAVDDVGTNALTDDTLPGFTGRGPTAADGISKPDVVAPGAHVISLNATGSSIATNFPTSVTEYNGAYRKGSGTSFATGIVSGAVALLLQRQPTMDPDRAKFVLTNTAVNVASTNVNDVGAGIIDVSAAATDTTPGLANQGLEHSNGLGSIDASRGTVKVAAADPAGAVVHLLQGVVRTAQNIVWNPDAFVNTVWDGSSWYGSSWYGSSWYDTTWTGATWQTGTWSGSSWYGQPAGTTTYGGAFSGSSWYGVWD